MRLARSSPSFAPPILQVVVNIVVAYQLTDDAILDVDAIWLYLLERDSEAVADRIVEELFQSFQRLAQVPNSGHRRPDLTARNVLFYRLYSYLVVYQPGSECVRVLGVLHGKRNVARILRDRNNIR